MIIIENEHPDMTLNLHLSPYMNHITVITQRNAAQKTDDKSFTHICIMDKREYPESIMMTSQHLFNLF